MFREGIERIPGSEVIAEIFDESKLSVKLPKGEEKPKARKEASRVEDEILVPQTYFMRELLPPYLSKPQTKTGQAILQQRRMDTEMKLAEIVISRLAFGFTLKRFRSPLEMLLLCTDPRDISPNLLIGQVHLRTKWELEEASKAFLVGAVVKTTRRLWELSILEVAASEKNTLKHLQSLKARRWSRRKIAEQLCGSYGLPLEQFYTEQPPVPSSLPLKPEPKFIRI